MQRRQLLASACFVFIMQFGTMAHAAEPTPLPTNGSTPKMPPVQATPAAAPVLKPQLVQTEPLTLEAAISIARQRYPSIRASLAKLAASEGKVDLAKTGYLPRSDFFFQTNWASANQLSGLFVPMPGLIPVAGGNTTQNWHGYWGNYDGLVTSWTAYDFGYRKAELNAAKAGTKAALAEQKLTEFDVAAAAANAFLQAATAQSLVKTAEADFDRSRVLLTMVSTLVKSGLRPGADQSRALADVAQSETRLIKAREQAKLALISLAHNLGMAGEDISIQADPFLLSSPASSSVSLAINEHPAVQAELSTIEELQAKRKAISRSYFPKLNVVNAITGRGSGFMDGQTQGGLKGTYPTLMNYAFAVAINYSPTAIFEAHAKEKIAKADIDAEVAKYDELIEQLKTADAQSREMIDSAMAIALHTPVQVEAAKMANVQVTQRYRAGLATLVDVAEAQKVLTQAEIDDSLAKLGVWSAFLGSTESKGTMEPFLNLVHQYQSMNLGPGSLSGAATGSNISGASAVSPSSVAVPDSMLVHPNSSGPSNMPSSPNANQQSLGLPNLNQGSGSPLSPDQIHLSPQPQMNGVK